QPFCQHFGVCGGCQWQMLPYDKQLQYKQKQVWDNLTRIGKIALPQMLPILGAVETNFYRNKLEYTFSTKEFTPAPPPKRDRTLAKETNNERDFLPATNNGLQNSDRDFLLKGNQEEKHGQGVFGFHAKGFFDKVVDIKKCWLQPEPTNELRNSIRDFAYQNNLSFYDIREHKGLLRTIQVRTCSTGEVMVNVVFGEDDLEKREQVLKFIQQQFPHITTLLYTINLKKNDSLFDLEPIAYNGKGYVVEKLEDFSFKIGPKSFFQTNTAQGERLYKITRDFAELDGSQIVYDLYCGTGSIGIFCSKGAKKIIGVEMVEAAINDAKENAALNGIDHAQFFTGDVIDVCNDEFFSVHGRPHVIITDPPRAGMHEKLVRKILDMEAPTVVYVSCNPATQARDLFLLDEKYTVTKVQPVDMFPHTHHIENVVQLKLK
ncbi:MAG TPA: 23S rRNA (uracil(1939)-C(5))-methyltransferase RlmD, partial [Chitinophagaceae bacterium]|nr:23S rRNA (uracil(1939)-C(5))-methyltransferase RlmD [Chitinophagaceae bacterium]